MCKGKKQYISRILKINSPHPTLAVNHMLLVTMTPQKALSDSDLLSRRPAWLSAGSTDC